MIASHLDSPLAHRTGSARLGGSVGIRRRSPRLRRLRRRPTSRRRRHPPPTSTYTPPPTSSYTQPSTSSYTQPPTSPIRRRPSAPHRRQAPPQAEATTAAQGQATARRASAPGRGSPVAAGTPSGTQGHGYPRDQGSNQDGERGRRAHVKLLLDVPCRRGTADRDRHRCGDRVIRHPVPTVT